VAQLDGAGVRDRALKAADDMLQAHPTIGAIFAINDESALGTLASAQSRKRSTLVIVGYDAAPEAQKAILANTPLRADVAQQPRLIGQKTIDAIASYFAGQAPPARIAVPVKIVDADSLRASGGGARP
jgi:ribose transport system substrate-binding protein